MFIDVLAILKWYQQEIFSLTWRVSSGSQISNKRYNAHSTHWIRFLWFCCASFVENVTVVISGQSSRKSRSNNLRFVRNNMMCDGPATCCCTNKSGFKPPELVDACCPFPLDDDVFALISAIVRGFAGPWKHSNCHYLFVVGF